MCSKILQALTLDTSKPMVHFNSKVDWIFQIKHNFGFKIGVSARSIFLLPLVRKMKMKTIAEGIHNVLPLPGTCEWCSAPSPCPAPPPCSLLLSHSSMSSCLFSLHTSIIPLPLKELKSGTTWAGRRNSVVRWERAKRM